MTKVLMSLEMVLNFSCDNDREALAVGASSGDEITHALLRGCGLVMHE
jgi:hypothetical protein